MTTRLDVYQSVKLTPRLTRWLKQEYPELDDSPSDSLLRACSVQAIENGRLDEDLYQALTSDKEVETMTTKADQLFGQGPDVNVKDHSDRYATKRREASHKSLGKVFTPSGVEASLPSQLDNAKSGALLKHLASKSGLGVQLGEHEKSLLDEMAACDAWVGKMHGQEYDSIRGGQVKALLDDATSGGLEVTPIAFDSDVITFPLLTGELFPRVNVQDVPRGRRIEGASIGTPTVTWGTGDGSSISLFDTSSLISAIDTTIHPVTVAIEIGRDFLSDAAVDVGSVLTRLIGERLAAELDKVIATGNGSTQPQGLTNASGVGSVSTDNSTTGPPTLDDYSALMFGVGKQYRNAAMRCAFLSNDTSYQRSRAIRNDPSTSTTDQRPVLTGGDVSSFNNYSTLGWPHVVQNDVGNSTAMFVAMAKYRLYRRAGLELRFEQGGSTLARQNLVLLIARARFGGRLMDSNAAAKWTDGQS